MEAKKNSKHFALADHFCSVLSEPGPLGEEHLPQPPGTLRETPDFLLLDFSGLPLHMGRASALQAFVVEGTTGVLSLSLH